MNKSICSLHIGSDEDIFGFSVNDHFIFRKNLNFGQYEMHPSPRSIFYEDFVFQQLVDQWSTIVDQIRCQSTMEQFFETLHQKFMNKTDHVSFNSNCKVVHQSSKIRLKLSEQIRSTSVDFWSTKCWFLNSSLKIEQKYMFTSYRLRWRYFRIFS